MTSTELREMLDEGAVPIRYEYCVSLLVCSLRFRSRVYMVCTWEAQYLFGLAYTLLSLLLGWWGVPWGPVLTLRACWVNCCGGTVVTDELERWPNSITE